MSAEDPPQLDVVVAIVNYRSAALTLKCLESLRDEMAHMGRTRCVVVENASGDAEALAAGIRDLGFEDWVSLDVAPRNGGFAYGNNRVLRPHLERPEAERPRYFWLLNPDCEIEPGAGRALLDFMEPRPNVGIAGSRFTDADGEDFPHAYRFPNLLSELDDGLKFGPVARLLSEHRVLQNMGSEPTRIDWMPGASLMIRRQVFETVGLMDEGYFLYYEETDLCLAAARAGWQSWHVPSSRVMHIAGGSTGLVMGRARSRRLPPYWFESRRRYLTKNHGASYAALADVLHIGGLTLQELRWGVERSLGIDDRGRTPPPPHVLRDTLAHSIPGRAVRNLWARISPSGRSSAPSSESNAPTPDLRKTP